MILMWIVSIVLIGMAATFAWLKNNYSHITSNGLFGLWEIPTVIASIAAGIMLIATIICTVRYLQAEHKAVFINTKYHTAYTTDDVYWNNDEIDDSLRTLRYKMQREE